MNLIVKVGVILLVLVAIVLIHVGDEPTVEPVVETPIELSAPEYVEREWHPTPAPIIKFEDDGIGYGNARGRAW